MILDGHIHITDEKLDRAGLDVRMKETGVGGGVIISQSPASFSRMSVCNEYEGRLDNLFSWTNNAPHLFPFFWIDPTEDDAIVQVHSAVERGVMGFKVICTHFYPSENKAMEVFAEIAGAGKPILFHSGILWDGQPSSKYNRPEEFECLLKIADLRFSLAHISWPWCDECIAVYGKFRQAHANNPGASCEMFVDITPGTPRIYRRDALTKLLTVGYDVQANIIFGSDCGARDYSSEGVGQWIEHDSEVYKELMLDDEVVESIFSKNLKRFLGVIPSI
ncbi:amidohydrolase family protein [Candidatus Hydrogenedentota bacterium]